MSEVLARCTICDHEVTSYEGLTGCPKCGTKSLPCDPKQDVTVKINWHELRILAMWSEQWASQHQASDASMPQVIFSIARRIEVQHPEIKTPLTLGGEIRDLKQRFKIETNIPHEEGFDPTANV